MSESISYGVFVDERDGTQYKTVKIGSQVWMAENLKYAADGSVCYNNDETNAEIYGRLYDWKIALAACPKGWHLPTDEEWKTLIEYAGGDTIAGVKLKSKTGWNDDGNGTDDFGFTVLPGSGLDNGNFDSAGYHGGWWSATETKYNTECAWFWYMDYNYDDVSYDFYCKISLFSVRCLQD